MIVLVGEIVSNLAVRWTTKLLHILVSKLLLLSLPIVNVPELVPINELIFLVKKAKLVLSPLCKIIGIMTLQIRRAFFNLFEALVKAGFKMAALAGFPASRTKNTRDWDHLATISLIKFFAQFSFFCQLLLFLPLRVRCIASHCVNFPHMFSGNKAIFESPTLPFNIGQTEIQ